MALSKTGGPLKGIFDPAKKAAAAAVMDPPPAAELSAVTARNRKAGGRGVRISGYISPDLDTALRDEVVRRTVAERRTVSFNDVLCAALKVWQQSRGNEQ